LFNEAFEKAWDSEKPIYLCDDPLRRLCGFIAESCEWHYTPLTYYKP